MTSSRLDPSVRYPIGVFVKFLYSDEIKNLINKGLTVKYCRNAKFTDKTEYRELDNKYVTQTDVPITYSKFKNITAEDFVDDMHDEVGWYHIVTDDDFNYNDCVEVDI